MIAWVGAVVVGEGPAVASREAGRCETAAGGAVDNAQATIVATAVTSHAFFKSHTPEILLQSFSNSSSAGSPRQGRNDVIFLTSQEGHMPKYLLHVSYTAEGFKGLMKDGGSKRKAAATALVESLGGKLETFYYAFGDCDVFTIIDMPDSASAAAGSLILSGSGAATTKTTPLLTPEEIDAAVKKSGNYVPPGR